MKQHIETFACRILKDDTIKATGEKVLDDIVRTSNRVKVRVISGEIIYTAMQKVDIVREYENLNGGE